MCCLNFSSSGTVAGSFDCLRSVQDCGGASAVSLCPFDQAGAFIQPVPCGLVFIAVVSSKRYCRGVAAIHAIAMLIAVHEQWLGNLTTNTPRLN